MDDKERSKKRIFIIFVYFVILAIFSTLFYFWIKPEETCFDGIKNQNEEEIDCGGICKKCEKIITKDLVVNKAGAVKNGFSGQLDLYAEIYNPNSAYGSKFFDYEFIFKDSSGATVLSKKGKDFILPGETKYIIELNASSEKEFSTAEFKITNPQWIEFTEEYSKPELRVTNKKYSEINSAEVFSEARGLLKNDSPYDFSSIVIKVVLKDIDGNVLGLNSTEIKTVKTSEEREFLVFWPKKFPGAVMQVEVQPEVNIFDSESFMKKYFKSQSF